MWGTVTVEGDFMVVKLSGWRAVWAMSRGVKVPLSEVTAVDHDPGVYGRVPTKTRLITRQRAGLIKLGAYHSIAGWSFWACGLGRNAVVIETRQRRCATVVVEVENPVATVRALRAAAGLPVLGTTEAAPLARGRSPRRPRAGDGEAGDRGAGAGEAWDSGRGRGVGRGRSAGRRSGPSAEGSEPTGRESPTTADADGDDAS